MQAPRVRLPIPSALNSGRVCILSSVHPALDTRIFHKQARTLASAGYRVTLIARHPRHEWQEGVEICALPPGTPRAARPLLWWRLLLLALRSRSEIYHIHDPELLPVALLIKALTGAAVVYDAHEYYGAEVRTRHWIPKRLRNPAGWLTERIEKAIAARLSAAVTVNEHMNAAFLRVQPRSIAVHNYPPVEYFLHAAARERKRQVVYAGVLTAERGLATIYQAGCLLRRRFPDLEIAVAGPVDWSGLDPATPRDLDAWRDNAGARFLGTLPQREVPPLLRGAAVGWIPFQATPNNVRSTPNKLLEYMAAELPVVTSDFGYMRQIVTAAGCGLLAPSDEPARHGDQIAWLLEHPDDARAMGARGREEVLARYTWAAEGEKLLQLYAALLPAPTGQADG